MRLYNLVWPIPHNLRTFAAINQFFSSFAPAGATFKRATDSKVAIFFYNITICIALFNYSMIHLGQ